MATDAPSSVEAAREPSFLLAVPEKRLLRWIAGKLPRWILPDDMTALGVLAAFAVCAAYQLSNESEAWLWAASRAARNLRELAADEPAAPSR